ncbi:hypothetical protein GCM10027449_07620 [Sinomonas notoginsengisoli]|uniref:hypothetical protein n=1 Tax=Sinomonas notoginsengisoli TaxID=1457311 RepID=UPI001F36F746|nr:hypothetical protein [Sinomonas notoginsengisoli]
MKTASRAARLRTYSGAAALLTALFATLVTSFLFGDSGPDSGSVPARPQRTQDAPS